MESYFLYGREFNLLGYFLIKPHNQKNKKWSLLVHNTLRINTFAKRNVNKLNFDLDLIISKNSSKIIKKAWVETIEDGIKNLDKKKARLQPSLFHKG